VGHSFSIINVYKNSESSVVSQLDKYTGKQEGRYHSYLEFIVTFLDEWCLKKSEPSLKLVQIEIQSYAFSLIFTSLVQPAIWGVVWYSWNYERILLFGG